MFCNIVHENLRKLCSILQISHPPVDDAIPDRLPQARPTTAVESSGLHLEGIEN